MQLALAARLACIATAIVFCAGAHANSTDDAVIRASRIAYDTAMKCAVANGLAGDEYHDEGDETKAAAYKAKARHSFDVTYQLGAKLGLPDKKIGHDLDFAQMSELPRMMRDRSYYLSTAAVCKAIGLM